MSLSEKFITECNEKADELTKEGAMMDDRGMAHDSSQHCPAAKRGGVRGVPIRSQFSLSGGSVGKIVKNSNPSLKHNGAIGQERRSKEASFGVVCGCKQISLHEVWKVLGEGLQSQTEKMEQSTHCEGIPW